MNKKLTLAAYSFSHFCVDFACFYILFGGIADPAALAWQFLLYNAVAFGLQFIFGAVCDAFPKLPAGFVGCALVAAAVPLMEFRVASIILCGVGNAIFHVAGGIDSLKFADGRISRGGIFVSAGAPGVALGTLWAQSGGADWLPLTLILASAALTLRLCKNHLSPHTTLAPLDAGTKVPFALLVLLPLISIFVRSFVGSILPSEWKTGTLLILLAAFAACAGKALGGILADILGARLVGVSALVISVPLALLGANIPELALLGVFFFNFTMPINLAVVASALPKNEGLAFGLSTLALLLGVAPLYFIRVGKSAPYLIIALCATALAATLISTNNKRRPKNAPYIS